VIKEKLSLFRGLNREMDDKTSQLLGKLLIDEADEDVDPPREAYAKFYHFSGGLTSLVAIGIFSLVI